MANTEVVDPIILDTKVLESSNDCCCCCCACDVPDCVVNSMSGSLRGDFNDKYDRYLAVSLGIFSIVRITRPTQLLVDASEYCVPDKECVSARNDDPCCIFNNMSFPISEFCPSTLPSLANENGFERCDRHSDRCDKHHDKCDRPTDKGGRCGC